MNGSIKKDIIYILTTVIDILESQNVNWYEIKKLSNHTIHNASVFQDEDSISTAVLVYSISKIVEREGDVGDKIRGYLKNSLVYLKEEKFDAFKEEFLELFDEVKKVDSQLKLYISEVISQAQIKKGTKLYDHGISAAKAAELFGVSQWELMRYAGQTQTSEFDPDRMKVKVRLNYVRSLFN